MIQNITQPRGKRSMEKPDAATGLSSNVRHHTPLRETYLLNGGPELLNG